MLHTHCMLTHSPKSIAHPCMSFSGGDWDLDHGWWQPFSAHLCQDPVLPPWGSFRPRLPPWLPAQLTDTKKEPQLQPSVLVHEWEFGDLPAETGVVASWLCPTQRYPETWKTCTCHILAWKLQLRHFPALSVLTSPSLSCSPKTLTFLKITVSLCFSSSCD